jgi:RNA polymerase sigma-70 factor (sigma-E family)
VRGVRTTPEVVIDPQMNDGDARPPCRARSFDPSTKERAAAFECFVQRHGRELGRLAYLMLGDRDAADDLTGDAFLAAWQQWDMVRVADHPLAYMRRLVVNMAGTRIRRSVRERRGLLLFHGDAADVASGTDTAAVIDVRTALARLPARRRACVVLRYGFDVSEQEVARILGVSVGTVKSQTSKGVAQLRPLLGAAPGGAPRRTRSWDEA